MIRGGGGREFSLEGGGGLAQGLSIRLFAFGGCLLASRHCSF